MAVTHELTTFSSSSSSSTPSDSSNLLHSFNPTRLKTIHPFELSTPLKVSFEILQENQEKFTEALQSSGEHIKISINHSNNTNTNKIKGEITCNMQNKEAVEEVISQCQNPPSITLD